MRRTALTETAQPPFHTVGRSTGILIVAVTLVAFVHRPCLNPKSNAQPTGRPEDAGTPLRPARPYPQKYAEWDRANDAKTQSSPNGREGSHAHIAREAPRTR
ncbi:hypothetical protein LBMAG38_08010 [Chloroflexota bacterium]|nr:hypothetical protein LBMAG38_08010 [Chloroflexota bacterium]